jgi:hypothetical protein
MSRYKPAIVVAAYDRPQSLERLLNAVKNARKISGARLVISIDNKAPDNFPVRELAQRYKWPHGEKEVLYQPQHLGLRKHILQCGDLAMEFGAVIILEDDLYSSPYFYDYAIKALEYYDEDPQIGGISLYNQPIQEISQYPFSSINDSSDVYFLKFPSSLGQAWTADQWKVFKSWYENRPDLAEIAIPRFIRNNWPETSWKKYFCGYLVETDKYFVFPRISFTTNFNDPGSNLKKLVNHQGQTPLRLFGGPYRFRKLTDSYAVYDQYLELEPACIKILNPSLVEYPFEMDLYGTKEIESFSSSMVITLKNGSNPIRSYKRALKPHEMNIIFDLPGEDFHLYNKEDILPEKGKHIRRVDNYKYFYSRNILGWKAQLYNYYLKLKYRILRK